jgi:hydrogenase maturation protease
MRSTQGKGGRPSAGKLVIVGIGNLLLGDEGFGPHVVRELRKHRLSRGTKLCDCGTGGLSVLGAIEGFEKAIVVDAISSGGEPGAVYRYKLQPAGEKNRVPGMISLHELDLASAMEIGRGSYRLPQEIIVIGAEPKTLEPGLELSPEVKRSVPKVIRLILEETRK